VQTLIRSPKVLGNAIQRARKKQNLSQAQLGEIVGLRQAAISQIERGHASLKLDNLLTLLAALNLELTIGPRANMSVQDIVDML
jgi:HTH-type transcriptional regulator / antitoxin HipB